jgi:GH18 family chitinase
VASWSYDAAKREMISYDTPAIIAKKARLIHQEGLGGSVWWESSSDKKGADSLIFTVHAFPFPPGRFRETGGEESNANNVNSL